jgi:hypothetical protein
MSNISNLLNDTLQSDINITHIISRYYYDPIYYTIKELLPYDWKLIYTNTNLDTYAVCRVLRIDNELISLIYKITTTQHQTTPVKYCRYSFEIDYLSIQLLCFETIQLTTFIKTLKEYNDDTLIIAECKRIQ